MGLDISRMKTRLDIWNTLNSKPLPISCLNKPIPWYPEQAGYEVCRIENGMIALSHHLNHGFDSSLLYLEGTTLLNCDDNGFSVYDDKG